MEVDTDVQTTLQNDIMIAKDKNKPENPDNVLF